MKVNNYTDWTLIQTKTVIRIAGDLLRDRNNPTVKAMKRAMGKELIKLIKQAYRDKAKGGTDELGRRWKPTKRFLEGKGLILIRTRRLLNGFKFRMTDTGFQIVNEVPYAKYQFPTRRPWPYQRTIPKLWRDRLQKIAEPYLKEIFKEAAKNYNGKMNGVTRITFR